MSAVIDRYRDLMGRLDALDAAGLNDSPEADAIRDEADGPWYAMTEAEQEEVRRALAGEPT